MDPRQLFPVLALLFAVLAAAGRWRQRRWRGAPSTWALLALIFGLVSLWLHTR
jgi:hypothetical protein